MHLLYKTLSPAFIILILTACGGGGGGGSSSDESSLASITPSEQTGSTGTSSTNGLETTHTIESSTAANISANTSLSNSTPILSPSSLNLALDNMGKSVQKPFNGYDIKVLSDKNLPSSEETSQETIAVYGTINGVSTKALLKINSHYRQSNLTIEVYKNGQLLTSKKNLSLTDQIALNFGSIEIQ